MITELVDRPKILIGKGAFGSVYKIEYNGKLFALKEINIHSKIKRENLQYEIDIMEKLNKLLPDESPFPKLLDYYWSDNQLQILMEYLNGEELFSLITSKEWKTLSSDRKDCLIIMICLQLLKAIKLLHDNGIVHRDIKLENVYVDYNKSQIKLNSLYLLDFGFSCSKDDYITCSNGISGTYKYLSPQLSDKYIKKIKEPIPFELMQKSDIWSFGVALYIMVYGKYHISDSDTNMLLIKISQYRYFIKYPFEHKLFTPILKKIFSSAQDRPSIDELINIFTKYKCTIPYS